MAKVAINGMGRIGKAAFKIVMDTPELELVAVNDLLPLENVVYMLKYDTVYGRYKKHVESSGGMIKVEGREVRYLSEKEPDKLPWKDMEVDIVLECTGRWTDIDGLKRHIKAGAKHVILSAPSKSAEVLTVVHGVNNPAEVPEVMSCASCTTNSITPVVEVMGRRIGVKKAIMTTVHAYTSSQSIVDGANKNLRRGRAGAANFVPTSTGAAKATIKALPQYKGKFDGVAVRAPVPVGSISDIVFLTERPTSKEEVNNIFREESKSERYNGILGITEEPIVSSDIVGDSHASIVDLEMTQVVDGDLVKVMSWYDNEWGYSSQLVREAARLGEQIDKLGRKAA
ncbi:MAG TPA: type I glyceraldehyde-3-phosphate dehydrogenase [Nitrospirota bacterium]